MVTTSSGRDCMDEWARRACCSTRHSTRAPVPAHCFEWHSGLPVDPGWRGRRTQEQEMQPTAAGLWWRRHRRRVAGAAAAPAWTPARPARCLAVSPGGRQYRQLDRQPMWPLWRAAAHNGAPRRHRRKNRVTNVCARQRVTTSSDGSLFYPTRPDLPTSSSLSVRQSSRRGFSEAERQ